MTLFIINPECDTRRPNHPDPDHPINPSEEAALQEHKRLVDLFGDSMIRIFTMLENGSPIIELGIFISSEDITSLDETIDQLLAIGFSEIEMLNSNERVISAHIASKTDESIWLMLTQARRIILEAYPAVTPIHFHTAKDQA